MRSILISFAALLCSASMAFADFTIQFDWGNTPACNTGRAKRVASPQFVIRGLPQGTTEVQFRMKDLDVPSYNHGGGKVAMTQDGVVPAGAFKYKGPCPPSGSHTYQWTATAKQGGKVLDRATAQRRFPN